MPLEAELDQSNPPLVQSIDQKPKYESRLVAIISMPTTHYCLTKTCYQAVYRPCFPHNKG